jgi:hypothetical protein
LSARQSTRTPQLHKSTLTHATIGRCCPGVTAVVLNATKCMQAYKVLRCAAQLQQ